MREGGPTNLTSRSSAGPRLHPEVRPGAARRRRCEWGQPHTLSWRPAAAGDAEWISGKSRTRLAPALTDAPSWRSDRRARTEGGADDCQAGPAGGYAESRPTLLMFGRKRWDTRYGLGYGSRGSSSAGQYCFRSA